MTNHFQCGRQVGGQGVGVRQCWHGMLIRLHRPVKRVLGTGRGESVEEKPHEDEGMHERLIARQKEVYDLLFGGFLPQLVAGSLGSDNQRKAAPEMRGRVCEELNTLFQSGSPTY